MTEQAGSGGKGAVWINAAQFYALSENALAPLHAAGLDCVLADTDEHLDEATVAARAPQFVAVIAGNEPWNERTLADASRLKVIARFGVGYDAIDVAACTRRGIAVAMAFGANQESVADQTFAYLGALTHDLGRWDARVREGGWRREVHLGMWGITLGIVGLGRIGKQVAKRARAFEMRVLAYDTAPDHAFAAAHGIELVSLDEVLALSDALTLHVPLSATTRNMIDARALAALKPGAYVINTARGGVVDEAALAKALTAGHVAGAGVDVFENEPPVGSPLLDCPNAILSPHSATVTVRTARQVAERCTANILSVLQGRDPGNGLVLNPEVLPAGR